MSTKQVADSIVKLCSEGKFEEAVRSHYADDVVSIEAGAPPGQSRETKGIEGVMGKNKWWVDNHEVHSSSVEGPLVADPYFSVKYSFDVTSKPQAKRFQMQEVAVYKVENDKIVREEFFYSM